MPVPSKDEIATVQARCGRAGPFRPRSSRGDWRTWHGAGQWRSEQVFQTKMSGVARCMLFPGLMEQRSGTDNAFVSVSWDPVRRVARVTRSAERPRTIEEIAAAFDEAARALDQLDRLSWGLLIDLRAAPGRNDPAFEQAMAKRRLELMRGFKAVAILVQTPVGHLQVSRITREDGSSAKTFSDEPSALAWLLNARA